MASPETITVTITKWEKYNPRNDVKRPSWFRVEYSMIDDPDFYSFSHEEFRAWFYLMALACRKNSPCIRVNFEHVKVACRISKRGMLSAIEKLRDLEIVTVDVPDTLRVRDGDVTNANATYERTNNTNKCSSFDFESVYQRFPRKQGKTAGLAKARRDVRSDEDFQLLIRAVERFKTHHRQAGTDPKFIPYFSTFMTGWRDWLDTDAGKTRLPPAGGSETTAEYLARKARENQFWDQPNAQELIPDPEADAINETPESIGAIIDRELAAVKERVS